MAMPHTTRYRPGQRIRYTALKANGEPYRWNDAWIAEVRPNCIILNLPPGVMVEGLKYGRPTRYRARHYIWLDRPYNLFEAYDPDGTPRYIYLNVASRPELLADEIRYTDYELNLAKGYHDSAANLLDEDEFSQAIVNHGYSPAFQTECWAAVAEARALLQDWPWHPEGAPPLYQPGQSVRLDAYKASGQLYRGCFAHVESITLNHVVLTYPAGTPFYGPKGNWTTPYQVRAHLWTDRWYNLFEVRNPDGQLIELYVNIASPAEVLSGEVRYTDYELDVVKKPGQPAKVEDEDEFLEATETYGYTKSFQQLCWEAVAQAIQAVETWPITTVPEHKP